MKEDVVNHEYGHGHAGPAPATTPTAHSDTVEPGRASRSAALRRPEHPVASGLVQRKARDASAATPDIHDIADRGMVGAAGALPHLETIQRAFGPEHDVSAVRSFVGGSATEAAAEMGALAYARGDQVAFADAPSLHTAAHEAAHVVQQRAGVHLKSGVGEVGDAYERHADAVADAVVRGDSARELLAAFTGPSSTPHRAVQRAPAPGHGAPPAHAARPTAGPSADDRGVHDFQTRVTNIADAGGGCKILLGGGSARGLCAGMPGYVKAGSHLLVEFQIAAVEELFSIVQLPMPGDAVMGCHDAVVNPTSTPGPAHDITAQIIAAEHGSGGVKLVINAGAPGGVRAGMTAYMSEHEGAPPFKRFLIDAVHGRTCQAFVPLPNDDLAKSYPHVVINPSSGGGDAAAHPAVASASGHGRHDHPKPAAAREAHPPGRKHP
jgi:IS5 family transposase